MPESNVIHLPDPIQRAAPVLALVLLANGLDEKAMQRLDAIISKTQAQTE